MKGEWKLWHSFIAIVIIIVLFAAGLAINENNILLRWGVSIGALILFTTLVSWGVTGRWLGWLINEQYRMSLSRLQIFLWTVVVLSAFYAAAFTNIKAGYPIEAINIGIPEELWLAMGISTTALAGSSLILSEKKKQPTNENAVVQGMNLTKAQLASLASDKSTAAMEKAKKTEVTKADLMILNETNKNPREFKKTHPELADTQVTTLKAITNKQIDSTLRNNTDGSLHRNESPADAKLSDLFSGEEVSNWNVIDFSRLQNLFFTLILVGAYAAAIVAHFNESINAIDTMRIEGLPELSAGFVALLGISHASYLVTKAVPKQPEG